MSCRPAVAASHPTQPRRRRLGRGRRAAERTGAAGTGRPDRRGIVRIPGRGKRPHWNGRGLFGCDAAVHLNAESCPPIGKRRRRAGKVDSGARPGTCSAGYRGHGGADGVPSAICPHRPHVLEVFATVGRMALGDSPVRRFDPHVQPQRVVGREHAHDLREHRSQPLTYSSGVDSEPAACRSMPGSISH